MSDGRIIEVHDATDTVVVSTTTGDKDEALEALQHSPEEESMLLAQERYEPAPPPRGTYEDRCDEARRKYADFDKVAFRDVDVYQGVLEVIRDHEGGCDLQYQLATNPKLARELLSMSVPRAMAKASALADRLAQGEDPRRRPAFADISE